MLKEGKNTKLTEFKINDSLDKLSESPLVLQKAKEAKDFFSKYDAREKPVEALLEKIASNAKITIVQASDALDAVISAVESSLTNDGRVTLSGFGTFSIAKHAAKTSRNPRTGKEIKVKAKKVAKFQAGTELVRKINK